MTITPIIVRDRRVAGYIVKQGKYITCAPTRAIGIIRIFTWMMFDGKKRKT